MQLLLPAPSNDLKCKRLDAGASAIRISDSRRAIRRENANDAKERSKAKPMTFSMGLSRSAAATHRNKNAKFGCVGICSVWLRWTFSGSYAHFRSVLFSGGPRVEVAVGWGEASGGVWRPKTFHVYCYYYTTFFRFADTTKASSGGWLNLAG